MGVEDPDRENSGIQVVPVSADDVSTQEGGLSLPVSPELDQALQEALQSIEKTEKKTSGPKSSLGDMSPKERESLQSRIRDLHLQLMEKEKLIEDTTKEVEKYKDQAARRQADLENYKKRVQKEKADQFNYGNEEIAREILHVLDNLDRALAHGKSDSQALLDGLELTRRVFEQTFQRFGIVPIETVGKQFDPNIHEAVAQIPSPDHQPGTVIHEQQRGFMLKDRLLRPAMVIVAGGPPEEHN